MRRFTTERIAPRAWLLIAILAIVASLGLAACGGDDDDEGTTTPAATETTGGGGGGGETVKMTATDFKFTPDNPTVKAGQVTFDVVNDGQTVHNIEIEGPKGDVELPSDIAAGESGRLVADLSQPGTYKFFCPVGNHEQLGMVGEVKVQ